MAKSRARKIIALALCMVSVAFVAVGIFGLNKRGSAQGGKMLDAMRTRALLVTVSDVEFLAEAAKQEAVAEAKKAGAGMSAIREASEKADKETRAQVEKYKIDYNAVDLEPVNLAILSLHSAMRDFDAEKTRAQAAYIEKQAAVQPAPTEALIDATAPEPAVEGVTADIGMAEIPIAEDEEPKVDLSDFKPTEEMDRLTARIEEEYQRLADVVRMVAPLLTESLLDNLKPIIQNLTFQNGDTYEKEYDRYAKRNALDALGSSALNARLARVGDDLITVGVAIILVMLMVLFYDSIVRSVGLPFLIISSFYILLCVLAMIYDLSITKLLSDTIVRAGMNGVLVLAMLPAIQCGIGLNLGLPIGVIGGLIGGLLCIEMGYSGWPGFLFSIAVGLAISLVLGYLYGQLLNRLKGNEMAVTTYLGFSFVSLMSIGWIIFPFSSLVLKWPLGKGLRTTISMEPAYSRLLDKFLAFKIGGITIPTGLILAVLFCCFIVWLFSRSKTGIAMQAVGNNPRFAEATGISVDKMRIIGTMISTVLGAVGILVFSQSYGFMQLYTAPRPLGLIAASAILIGGASTTRAKISNVLIGSFLFQGVLTLGMPVANVLVPGSMLAEVLRTLISYGIILYALTKSGGGSRA